MDDEGSVAEESTNALNRRCEVVGVRRHKGVRCDLAVLTRQVTDLAGLRQSRFTGRCLEHVSLISFLVLLFSLPRHEYMDPSGLVLHCSRRLLELVGLSYM